MRTPNVLQKDPALGGGLFDRWHLIMSKKNVPHKMIMDSAFKRVSTKSLRRLRDVASVLVDRFICFVLLSVSHIS